MHRQTPHFHCTEQGHGGIFPIEMGYMDVYTTQHEPSFAEDVSEWEDNTLPSTTPQLELSAIGTYDVASYVGIYFQVDDKCKSFILMCVKIHVVDDDIFLLVCFALISG